MIAAHCKQSNYDGIVMAPGALTRAEANLRIRFGTFPLRLSLHRMCFAAEYMCTVSQCTAVRHAQLCGQPQRTVHNEEQNGHTATDGVKTFIIATEPDCGIRFAIAANTVKFVHRDSERKCCRRKQ